MSLSLQKHKIKFHRPSLTVRDTSAAPGWEALFTLMYVRALILVCKVNPPDEERLPKRGLLRLICAWIASSWIHLHKLSSAAHECVRQTEIRWTIFPLSSFNFFHLNICFFFKMSQELSCETEIYMTHCHIYKWKYRIISLLRSAQTVQCPVLLKTKTIFALVIWMLSCFNYRQLLSLTSESSNISDGRA